MGSFHRVFKAFMTLRRGEKLGNDVNVEKLAHGVYLHAVTIDQKRNHEQELLADQAATLHLFLIALTDSLDKTHTWTEYWKYSLIGSKTLERKLLWFARLFGFGVATNIALDVHGSHASATHPEKEQTWARNVRVWNNCAMAFSNVTTLKR